MMQYFGFRGSSDLSGELTAPVHQNVTKVLQASGYRLEV